jgi:hypothetical protein
MMYGHNLKTAKDREVAIMLWCAAAEAMLSQVNGNLIFHHKTEVHLAFHVLDSVRGLEDGLRTYWALCAHRSAEKVLEEKGMGGFWGAWMRLRKVRNRYAHGRLCPGCCWDRGFAQPADLERMRMDMLRAFIVLNNEGTKVS